MSDFVMEDGVMKVLDPEIFLTWQERPDFVEALIASPDAEVRRKKKLVMDFNVELLRCLVAERVDEEIDGIMERYVTEDYIQHDPNIDDGREALAEWFRKGALGIGKGAPLALTVEGNLVNLLIQLPLPDPDDPESTYDFFLLTSYRVRGDKLAEHWAPWKKNRAGERPGFSGEEM